MNAWLAMRSDAFKSSNSQEHGNHNKYMDIKVILCFFQMIGLAPFSCVKSNCVGITSDKGTCHIPVTIKFVRLRFGYIYNVFLVVADLLISIGSIRRLCESKFSFSTSYTLSVDLFQAVCSITLMNGLWLFTSFRRDHMVTLLNRLVEVDSTILRLSNSPQIRLCRLHVIGVSVALTIIWIVLIIADVQLYDSMILDWFNDIVPSFVIIQFMLQYVLMVKMVEMGYRSLNCAIINSSPYLEAKTFRSFTAYGEIAIINRDHLPKIIDFRRAHNTLYEIGSDIAKFYSLPMLLVISLSCFAIIYNAYNGILPLTRSLDIDRMLFVVVSISWVSALIIPIAFLAKSVDSVTDEMRQTFDAIYKLLDGSDLREADITELERFSMELLHRKIHFSAYGLFSLDCSLVHSILSSTITYLVILFQFQISTVET